MDLPIMPQEAKDQLQEIVDEYTKLVVEQGVDPILLLACVTTVVDTVLPERIAEALQNAAEYTYHEMIG